MSEPNSRTHKFYSNECVPLPVVTALRDLGHDVLTTREAGKDNRGIQDESVLGYAIRTKRAVLTCDRVRFVELHREKQGDHCGIIVCTQDKDFQRFAFQVHEEVKVKLSLAGELIRITKPST